MPTADATLLPPVFSSHEAEERGSARRLDEVGVEAVLGAMIEQKRRASQPSFAAIDLLPESAQAEHAAEAHDDGDDDDGGGRTGRAPTRSEVYLKAR